MTTSRRWLPAVAALPAAALCLAASLGWALAHDPQAAAASPVTSVTAASSTKGAGSTPGTVRAVAADALEALRSEVAALRERRLAAVHRARVLERRVARAASGSVAQWSRQPSQPPSEQPPVQPQPEPQRQPVSPPQPELPPQPEPPPVDTTTGASGG